VLHPKKVGTLPVKGRDEVKQTNEIKTAIPLLDAIEIQGKIITADALLTQTAIADYLVDERDAAYHFTVKGNQPTILDDIKVYFADKGEPDYIEINPPDHGRIETRKIWITTELNEYLEFPHVGQAFAIERHSINKKSGVESVETAYGITSRTVDEDDAKKVLKTNRDHWCIENSCHYVIDWNYDEDRSRIRTGYAPENITRLRRFATGVIARAKGSCSCAQKMRQLSFNPRIVLDYLKMTGNSCAFA
jgi:predicted transposase YbfD/YdcC